jgi:hypothetical protein
MRRRLIRLSKLREGGVRGDCILGLGLSESRSPFVASIIRCLHCVVTFGADSMR